MFDERVKTGSSSSSAGLLLRVRRSNGHTDEFYLANGLTIGRTVANTVVLADDTVDRTHARVDLTEDGTARLRCVGSDNKLSVGDTAVQEIGLTAGVRFRIGTTDFECVSGQRGPERDRASRGSACPSCGSKSVPAPTTEPVSCLSCGQSILVLDLGTSYPSPLVIPVKYGEFLADRYVARGGMGLVLHGRSEADNKPVAIKLLLPGAGVDRQAAERFKQEITLMKRVSNANVVRLLSYGRAEQFRYLIMEWVDGHNLRDTIADMKQRQKMPSFENVLPWFEQVCKGLAAVHAVGVIHRDIKPSNILIAQDGHVLLADLGVGKRADTNQTALTTTGQLPGTYEYMAPEQLSAPDTVDQRTDLYSLGIMFYELLTGDRPVGAWLPASQINPTVPPVFDQILSRLLARKPENRYSDIHDLLAAASVFKLSHKEPGQENVEPNPATEPNVPPPPVEPLPSMWSQIAKSFRLVCTEVKAICIATIAHLGILARIAAIRWKIYALKKKLTGLESEHQEAMGIQAAIQTHQGVVAALKSQLRPPTPVSWCRIGIGYAAMVIFVIGITCILLPHHAPIPGPENPSVAKTQVVELGNEMKLKLTLIPAGEFKMGSGESAEATAAFFNKTYDTDILKADSFKDEHPQHRVRITKPFYLGTYHVTRGQFRQFVTDTGYKTDAEKGVGGKGAFGWNPDEKKFALNEKYSWQNAGFEQTDEHPVVNVSWNDAVAFCEWLSKKEGKTYRLPTEAEWEYACRAGTTTRYSSGDDPETLAKVGNVADATFKAKFPDFLAIKASDGYVFTSPVSSFQPNAFGLYDMHGNAWQWCSDWYGAEYYAKSLADDPNGPDSGDSRVLRGGSWSDGPDFTRSATRNRSTPDNRNFSTGFRVSRTQ
ncbi:MAG: SUMF1/EgtB/PvdO family nonheme iron enzyme [Planctomycetota bacterium]